MHVNKFEIFSLIFLLPNGFDLELKNETHKDNFFIGDQEPAIN